MKIELGRVNFFPLVFLLIAPTYFYLQPRQQSNFYLVDEEVSAGMILINFTPDEERRIREAMSPLFTGRCSQAFADAGLRSPREVVLKSGVVFRPSADLYNYSARKLGLADERTRELYASEFSSGRAQAGTVSPMFKGVRLTVDGRPHIYLHDTAFLGGSSFFRRLELREVLIHESIHAVGQPPVPGWLRPLQHDLAGFAHYNRIMKACR